VNTVVKNMQSESKCTVQNIESIPSIVKITHVCVCVCETLIVFSAKCRSSGSVLYVISVQHYKVNGEKKWPKCCWQ
jgi:hypothetical protein